MNKGKEIICGIVVILFFLWLINSTVEVWSHQYDDDYVYGKANAWALIVTRTREMRVVDCVPEKGDEYLVTVEDINGNQYAYYSDTVTETETVVKVVMQGSRIADVKE